MTEKPTQSTSGNNILSKVEYDAVLSHLFVLSRSTHADHKEIKSIWQCLGPGPGIALRSEDIATALEATGNLNVVSGLGHEATRATQALLDIFTSDSDG